MKNFERFMRAVGFVLLMVAWTNPGAAGFAAPTTDGWHVWQVEASDDSVSSCCYHFRNGDVSTTGCDLDGRGGFSITRGDCDLDGDSINIFVRISDGMATRIRALNADCPVTTKTTVLEHGTVPAPESVNWLARQIDENPRAAEDAMAAISAHSADAALPALIAVLEDRARDHEMREQALFWVAQLPSDAAFDYLDKLLSHNQTK